MADRAAKDALYEGFAEVARALASGRRAEIVDLLAQGERPVEQIAAEIGQSIANTSHHLRAMARAGLVTTRRDGTRIFYTLASDRVAALWSELQEVAAEHVAGLHRLAGAYLGSREDIELAGPGARPGGRDPIAHDLPVAANALREQVRGKSREVAAAPGASFRFHTGRGLTRRLGYEAGAVDALPDRAVESFAGVGNPFSLRRLAPGEQVVDVGSGAGFDSFIAAGQVGPAGQVVGVDMTAEMLAKARQTAAALGLAQVQFREGLAEALPVENGWADVVISNGVINLCADKQAVFAEILRVLRPGGRLQFADIANGRPRPAGALRDIALWAG